MKLFKSIKSVLNFVNAVTRLNHKLPTVCSAEHETSGFSISQTCAAVASEIECVNVSNAKLNNE